MVAFTPVLAERNRQGVRFNAVAEKAASPKREDQASTRAGIPRFLQAKLALSQPDDAYEHEADRVADQVMRMPEQTVQRKCAACGDAEPCAACKDQRPHVLRKSESTATAAVPSLPQGFTSNLDGGERLESRAQKFFEQRFGEDFSDVRVHTGADAASSTRTIGARAYTVGPHVVLGKDEYMPGTTAGRTLLAHELTHVIQQRHTGASIARWTISGNTATSDQEGDVLGKLALQVSGSSDDWPCIWPINMQSPKAWDDDYWHYIWIGDTFDISNLKLKTGPSGTFSFHMKGDLQALQVLYGGADPVGLEQEVANLADDGKTPIESLTITGHTAGDRVWGDNGAFSPTGLAPNEPAPAGAGAHSEMGPHRCWFTRNATVRIVGCSSETVAKPFAPVFLRKGAEALGTNHWLCGWHQTMDPTNKPVDNRFISSEGPPCNWPPSATRLNTAAEVNTAAGLWVTIKGKL